MPLLLLIGAGLRVRDTYISSHITMAQVVTRVAVMTARRVYAIGVSVGDTWTNMAARTAIIEIACNVYANIVARSVTG